MAFSEKTKNLVKSKSNFRCVICGHPFVEVHHIKPQRENGGDTLDNAVPLCARCHDLFGGNPEKRKQIKSMRDSYYKKVKKMETLGILDLGLDSDYYEALENEGIAIYHVVYKDEDFEKSACILMDLIAEAQKTAPGKKRILFLDIDGHRNSDGVFDRDMFELQSKYILSFLAPYLSEIYLPLGHMKNNNLQNNDVPDKVLIQDDEKSTFGMLSDDKKAFVSYTKVDERIIH